MSTPAGSYAEMWESAWRNIQADYKSGAISHHQFLKERNYMFAAKQTMNLDAEMVCSGRSG